MPDEGRDSAHIDGGSATTRAQGWVAKAALCFGMLLFSMTSMPSIRSLPSMIRGGQSPAHFHGACAYPHEIASEDGWTTDVGCGESQARADRRLRGPARLLFGLTLDLNRADQRALEVLPQIGPRRAAAIVDARAEAEFASVAELARVHGIGVKTIAGLEGWVGVGGSE